MDIKTLLERIKSIREKLNSAKNILSITESNFRRGGVFAESERGNDYYLSLDKELIREIVLCQKQALEVELATLEDAKETAERIVAGLLPDSKTAPDQR
ncbi:hypothetical protein [Serratia aquatilis]|uniref:Uncharacterized protein n=1 Tax=Serratia aquatilis TaxID=1737515 RepID=A0ABV6EG93_9GAMM